MFEEDDGFTDTSQFRDSKGGKTLKEKKIKIWCELFEQLCRGDPRQQVSWGQGSDSIWLLLVKKKRRKKKLVWYFSLKPFIVESETFHKAGPGAIHILWKCQSAQLTEKQTLRVCFLFFFGRCPSLNPEEKQTNKRFHQKKQKNNSNTPPVLADRSVKHFLHLLEQRVETCPHICRKRDVRHSS